MSSTIKINGKTYILKNRFLKYRLSLGYKRAGDFAKVLGISPSQYSRYENNESQPSLIRAKYICEYILNIPLDELFYLEEIKK